MAEGNTVNPVRAFGRHVKRRLGLGYSIWEYYQQDVKPTSDGCFFVDYFNNNSGKPMHKWHHYLPLYERYMQKFRGGPVRMLEIGVQNGDSSEMFVSFLGEQCTFFGVDIDPKCLDNASDRVNIRIGSQADETFLSGVVAEMGGVDIVLDDGSHRMDHVRTSLNVLFPKLSEGGVYFIEDLHTAYWRAWGGGYVGRGNVFNLARELVDDMHHRYHAWGTRHPDLSCALTGIHVHDSILVLEKGAVSRPVHSVSYGAQGEPGGVEA